MWMLTDFTILKAKGPSPDKSEFQVVIENKKPLTRLYALLERAVEAGALVLELVVHLLGEVPLQQAVGVDVALGGRVLQALPQPLQLLADGRLDAVDQLLGGVVRLLLDGRLGRQALPAHLAAVAGVHRAGVWG